MKYRLLAPGPTPVPDRVLRAMNQTIIHHRTNQFEEVFSLCQQDLAWLLDSKNAPLILSCSGTGAFEASIQTFFKASDTVLCITGGKFADNWLKLCRIFGLNAIEIPVVWGQAVLADEVKKALQDHPTASGVVLVASETSTGVRHPYEAIGEIVKEYPDCLFVVDAVTALGIWDICPSKEHIDVLVSGSQKGLMLPPGLGFVWASEKAWGKTSRSNIPKFYFDLNKEKKAQKSGQTSYTPAVSLILGLKEALAMMKEEGRLHIFNRHARLSLATRTGMTSLGLEIFAQNPTQAITSVVSPPSLAPDAVYNGLMDLANFTIAGGQDKLAGKIFRIGHMGYVDEIDVLSVFGALEIVLKKMGYEKFTPGASIAAASPVLMEGFRATRQR